MAKLVGITTIDNPFNPFTEFSDWYLFDTTHGYDTSAWLARIATTSGQLTDSENVEEIESAVDFIISHDLGKIYKKLVIDDSTIN